jgi:hypothetical protein
MGKGGIRLRAARQRQDTGSGGRQGILGGVSLGLPSVFAYTEISVERTVCQNIN